MPIPATSDPKKVLSFEENGRVFIKSFLIDSSVNLNGWGVTESSIAKNIYSAIGKPIVLQANFDHPNLDDKDYTHALAYQDLFRVATVIDVIPKPNGVWEQIAEVTDEGFKRALREQPDLPIYVSPTIRLLGPAQRDSAIEHWEVMHEAIVDQPAYGVKKAMINGQCSGDSQACLLQLRRAHIQKFGGSRNCGFCTYGALMSLPSVINTKKAQDFSPEDFEDFNDCVRSVSRAEPDMSNGEVRRYCRNLMRGASKDPSQVVSSHVQSEVEKEQDKLMSSNLGIHSPVTPEAKGVVAPTTTTTTATNEKPAAAAAAAAAPSVAENTANTNTKQEQSPKQSEAQQLADENAKLKQLVAQMQADAKTHTDLESQLSERLAALENERKAEKAALRRTEIASIVNSSTVSASLSPEEREKNIEFWNASNHDVESIRRTISQYESTIRKASVNNSTGHQTVRNDSRLKLGANNTVESREAKVASNDVPAYLQLRRQLISSEEDNVSEVPL